MDLKKIQGASFCDPAKKKPARSSINLRMVVGPFFHGNVCNVCDKVWSCQVLLGAVACRMVRSLVCSSGPCKLLLFSWGELPNTYAEALVISQSLQLATGSTPWKIHMLNMSKPKSIWGLVQMDLLYRVSLLGDFEVNLFPPVKTNRSLFLSNWVILSFHVNLLKQSGP